MNKKTEKTPSPTRTIALRAQMKVAEDSARALRAEYNRGIQGIIATLGFKPGEVVDSKKTLTGEVNTKHGKIRLVLSPKKAFQVKASYMAKLTLVK